MRLDSPRYIRRGEAGYGRKKFVVFADLGAGKIKRVVFGQRGVRIKRSNPERRSNFRARHRCYTKSDKGTAGYWSCKKW